MFLKMLQKNPGNKIVSQHHKHQVMHTLPRSRAEDKEVRNSESSLNQGKSNYFLYLKLLNLFSETIDLEKLMKEGDDEDIANEDNSDSEEEKVELPVKRVNFGSSEKNSQNYTQEASADTSDEDDFIAAFNESEDTFDEVIKEKKKEPTKYSRTSSRPAPGTVKLLKASLGVFNGSEDTFNEVTKEKKKETSKYRRTSTRPTPGSVKTLMAKLQNP